MAAPASTAGARGAALAAGGLLALAGLLAPLVGAGLPGLLAAPVLGGLGLLVVVRTRRAPPAALLSLALGVALGAALAAGAWLRAAYPLVPADDAQRLREARRLDAVWSDSHYLRALELRGAIAAGLAEGASLTARPGDAP